MPTKQRRPVSTRRLARTIKRLRLLLSLALVAIVVLLVLFVWLYRAEMAPLATGSIGLCWESRKEIIELCLKLVAWLIERR